MWGYPDEAAAGRDLTGWSIEAADGGIGKVDNANNEAGAMWLIVDTGQWIFGKRVMLPAGVVDRINSEDEVVHVNRTKEHLIVEALHSRLGLEQRLAEGLAAAALSDEVDEVG
jgi:hypothetical protein